jgi:hypothetical protein
MEDNPVCQAHGKSGLDNSVTAVGSAYADGAKSLIIKAYAVDLLRCTDLCRSGSNHSRETTNLSTEHLCQQGCMPIRVL